MMDFEGLRANKTGETALGQSAVYGPSAQKLSPVLFALNPSKSLSAVLDHIAMMIKLSITGISYKAFLLRHMAIFRIQIF